MELVKLEVIVGDKGDLFLNPRHILSVVASGQYQSIVHTVDGRGFGVKGGIQDVVAAINRRLD